MPSITEPRKKRYMQKVEHCRNRISHLEVWLEEIDANEPETKTLLAIKKACQEVVDVSTDMLAMMLKDNSIPPTDDYTNIRQASEKGLIPNTLTKSLREANGLRNRLIHVYNDIDIPMLVQSIERIIPGIKELLLVVEHWLSM